LRKHENIGIKIPHTGANTVRNSENTELVSKFSSIYNRKVSWRDQPRQSGVSAPHPSVKA
jgi:hypothetical protein